MKRVIPVGLILVLSLVLLAPAYAQSGENAEWQAIEDQRDKRRQAELLEAFIRKNDRSARRPDADKMLVDYYVSNNDNAKIMQHAESFRLTQASADNASKSYIFMRAMVAGATLNNVNKTKEYGEYALQADPNNLTVLVFMAGNGLPDAAKAMEYTKRAATLPKPPTMQDSQYQSMQARIHGNLGNALFTESKFKEANDEFTKALQANPKDHAIQYRVAYAPVNLMTDAVRGATTANDELIKAMAQTPSNAGAVADAKTKMDEQSNKALEHRDLAMDALGKALAIGGQFAPQAKTLLDSLYQNKNKSLDGLDQYIAERKTALGL